MEYRAEKKHRNADGRSHRPEENCKQHLHIERWDEGPTHLGVEKQLGKDDIHSLEHGPFWSEN